MWLHKRGNKQLQSTCWPNVLRNKGNQTMKFGQLIDNMINIFLEKSYTKCGGETIPKTFTEKSKFSISLDQLSKVLYCLFLLHVQAQGYRDVMTLRCRPLAFTSFEAFSKNKKRSGTSFPASFSAQFFLRNIYLFIFC